MNQVIRKGLKEIIVDEVPDPVATPHHVLVRPSYSLISSGTEAASIHQRSSFREAIENPAHFQRIWEAAKIAGPVRTFAEVRAKLSEYAVLGYAGAGTVVEKHATVTDLRIGDRVAYGGEGTGHGETVLAGRNLVATVPEGVLLEHAAFATLGSIAMHAVRIAGLGLGDVVAVIGQGMVGQLIGQLVRLQGGLLTAIDQRPERVDLAKALGADHALLAGSEASHSIHALTGGRGADCVIVAAASKSPEACRQALDMCRDRGRLVITGAADLNFPWEKMYRKEIQLFMSRAYGPGSYDPAYEEQGHDYPISYVRWTENRNMEEFLRLLASGRVQVGPLITHQFALDEAPRAYQTILDPTSGSLAVLLKYPAAASSTPAAEFTPKRRVEVAGTAAGGQLRVALAGAGNLARWTHLPNLKKVSGAVLHAICSASGARGKSYALRFGAGYCCSDYQEILNDPAVDVVLISSRNQDHAAQAIAALDAGKHVFVEKPMAITAEECTRLSLAARQSGRQLTVGFNRRFAPFYLDLKRRLIRRSGPAVLNVRVNSPGISGSYWMADPAQGGAALGEACHFVDLMYWLLESEPVHVSAYSLPAASKDPIGENNLAASFLFADGSIGNLTYTTVGSKTSGGERVEAFAPGLGLATENFRYLTASTVLRLKRWSWRAERGHARQLESFLNGLREGQEPEVTVRDGTRATLACLQMLESARSLAPCAIDPDRLPA